MKILPIAFNIEHKTNAEGSAFNSGIMPATANSFFQFTFTKPGEFLYHCNIHPWSVASVYASNAFFIGNGFKIGVGSGATWNITNHPESCWILSHRRYH